ncbi:enoyl-CoA hydratase [Cladophialophora psammophila CBS 110553]|uniref:Enoyl-CoA hydratase n=1 Tax=Cladophialophora psammophila CBS 110553 TaxID=1182543 RepID=W9X3E0_9EURO|nr:enoyl-CoA hydratase [Cladophialophora psammophila CBS 110553]EXJ74723.1 enoyl-CoA hydratase [Cladophialophora psammophila CBS 110553]
MSESPIAVSKSPSGITTITITRPHRRNAVNPSTARALYAAFINFEEDASQKVAVFTGSEGAFCAGADLVDLTAQSKKDPATLDPLDRNHLQPVQDRNCGPMGPSRLQVKKPVIAAVAGHAVAGGLELSLLADMRVVEEDAIFGVYCRRWGVPLIDGGTVRLQAIVGLGRALDMILTGRPVSAQEALSMGLANRVVPKGKALEEAAKIAESLLRFPNGCMNVDRNSCYYAAYNSATFEDAMRNEYDRGVKVLQSESIPGAARFAAGLGRHGGFDKL